MYIVMELPSLGALSLTPTGAGTAKRLAGQICTLGSKGWGICIGPQNAERGTSQAIPVSNNPDENIPSVVPCIGGVYKLLRNPGLSNGIIYESDYAGSGHMCCVISDNTQYMGLNRLYSTIEAVLNIRTLLAQNPGPAGVAAAKALRNGMDEEVFYSDPLPQSGAVPRMAAYATSVGIAFQNMLRQKQADEGGLAHRRSLGMPQARNDQIFESDTAHHSWKNINLFVRLTAVQLNRIYRYDGEDKEMRANNNAVFAQHYLYLGTWQLTRRENGGSFFTPTALDNNPVHETLAMHELAKHLRGAAGSQAESRVVQAFQQLASPEFADARSSE